MWRTWRRRSTPARTLHFAWARPWSGPGHSPTQARAGRDGRFGTADDHVVPLKKSAYNSSRRSMTLTPFTSPPKSLAYQLTVKGTGAAALIDVNDNLLDGDKNGVAAGSYFLRFGATARASTVSALAS